MRRSGTKPPQSPEEAIQQRLSTVEGAPEPWRAGQTTGNGPQRIVAGGVNSSGSRYNGYGFTCSRWGVGNFNITFDVAFPAAPVIVASITDSGASSDTISIDSIDGSTVDFFIRWAPDGGGRDRNFHFIAIGPA